MPDRSNGSIGMTAAPTIACPSKARTLRRPVCCAVLRAPFSASRSIQPSSKSNGLRTVGSQVLLHGLHTQLFGTEEALELFPVVHQALGLDDAVLANQHRERQAAHPEGHAEIG